MGFTIGGLRDIRELRAASRRRGRATECTAVAEYTGLWGWDVMPGARSSAAGACSCGDPRCTEPGAHPLGFCPRVKAGATLDEVTRAWAEVPGAAVLLPVGERFDVIDVALGAGGPALARLERMGLPRGPVLATPAGRAYFFVAPGAAAELPTLLYRMGWDDADLDLAGLGPGSYVVAPPSPMGTLGPAHWLRPPSPDTAVLPPARLLLGTLAYTCHRVGRARPRRDA
ncbi:bifunctional DNA primase/polymerase [Streptomyces sp. DW26H14]|uniref:bifunctional DNA primase/polymerase n=1 Tax=Streptomyces sp. DW26H14 TaxID=3435395 RepID=UPI00403E05CD